MSENDKPPAVSKPEDDVDDDLIEGQSLNIENFHYHGNDLREFRKLAEINPKLAGKVLDQKERSEIRKEGSQRFGVGAAVLLLITMIVGSTYIVVNAGLLALLGLVMLVLAVALMIRVIVTGHWSDTSWVGHFINAIISLAGGKVPTKENGADKNKKDSA